MAPSTAALRVLLAQGLRKHATNRTSLSKGQAAALSRRGPRQLHLPGGAEVRTSPRPSVSLTRYEQPDCPRSLSACKHPNPDAVRKRSQAQRLGAGDAHSGSRRPGRRVAPSSKGIVTSAATARALCHGFDSRVGRLAMTGGDRRIVLSAQGRLLIDSRRPALPRLVATCVGPLSAGRLCRASRSWSGADAVARGAWLCAD
jgi:hypothetical protein